jgi:5'-3' exonuclease
MGFRNFYSGFKSIFSECISQEKCNSHDILIVELNGLFYKSCKSIYKGEEDIFQKSKAELQKLLFERVALEMHTIIMKYPPNETLLLVVDGVCPMMKNSEQRQRRYKNSLENRYTSIWDLNVFSPGTKMLHYLTKYLDWFIRKKMEENNIYKRIKIYFSNEKVFGEGEWKITKFLKKFASPLNQILIYSSDSDLILITMLLLERDITIIRHSSEERGKEFVSLSTFRKLLKEKYQFDKEKNNDQMFFSDIFILVLLLGNDYIVKSPCVSDFLLFEKEILPLYFDKKKHLTIDGVQLHVENICNFFKVLSLHEKKWLIAKYESGNQYFYDVNFLQNYSFDEKNFAFDKYKEVYNEYFDSSGEHVVEYLNIFQNIMNMVHVHDFDWTLIYKHPRAPFLADFDISIFQKKLGQSTYVLKKKLYKNICFHLLTVIPPTSKYLLPESLKTVYVDLFEYYPSDIVINLTDKKKLWEGNIYLPCINYEKLYKYFLPKWNKMSTKEKKMYREGKTILYIYSKNPKPPFHSFYGNIQNLHTSVQLLDM